MIDLSFKGYIQRCISCILFFSHFLIACFLSGVLSPREVGLYILLVLYSSLVRTLFKRYIICFSYPLFNFTVVLTFSTNALSLRIAPPMRCSFFLHYTFQSSNVFLLNISSSQKCLRFYNRYCVLYFSLVKSLYAMVETNIVKHISSPVKENQFKIKYHIE